VLPALNAYSRLDDPALVTLLVRRAEALLGRLDELRALRAQVDEEHALAIFDYEILRQEADLAAGLADRAEVQVAYAIGRAKPVGLYVETFGTAHHGLTDAHIQQAVTQVFDLRPAAIIRELDLLRPMYARTAAYGHFGRDDLDLPWEQTNRVTQLRDALHIQG